jgi:two-component system phosphate regulon sensor histidine kinase PhoR
MIGVTALSVGYGLNGDIKQVLDERITRNLTQEAQLVANRIQSDRAHSLDIIASQEGQAAGARVTVIDTNGQVVADSEVAANSLSKEGRRPEFVTALHGTTGVEVSTRNGARVMFVAVPVSGGAVRLAYPLSEFEEFSSDINRRLAIACTAAAIAGLIISFALAKVLTI